MYAIGGLVAIATQAKEILTKEKTANQHLEYFPMQIPCASEIRKYKTPEAKHCLVHILQMHYTDEMEDKLNPDVKSIQEDIYKILSHLVNKHSLKEVYDEGLTDDAKEKFNNTIKEFLELKKRVPPFDKIEKDKISKEAYKKIQDAYKKIEETYQEIYQAAELKMGATGRLMLEGKIVLKDAETARLNDAAQEDALKGKITENVTDLRENVVLENIVRNKDIFAVCVYGGAHAFGGKQSFGEDYSLEGRISKKDNIHEWNIKNPDKKFSLIEVVPQSYKLRDK